jgi:hypothetical protein
MVECLLEIRSVDFRDQFAANKSTAQRKVLWGKVALKFNLEHALHLTPVSLQNKYKKLQQECSLGMLLFEKTGNAGDGLIEDSLSSY